MKILLLLLVSCAIKKPDLPENIHVAQEVNWKVYEDTDGDGVSDLIEYSLGFDPTVADMEENLVEAINLMTQKMNLHSLGTSVLEYSSGAFVTGELKDIYNIENTVDILQKKLGTVNESSKIYILLTPVVMIKPVQDIKKHIKEFPIQKPPPQIPRVQCYFQYGPEDRYLLDLGRKKKLPCDVSLPPAPPPPKVKPSCVAHSYFRPEDIWMPFKISKQRDIMNSLKIKIGEDFFSLNKLEEKRKIRFHWIGDYHPQRFSEKLLIVISDLSSIADIDGEIQVKMISSARSEYFYHGIETIEDHRPECVEFAASIGEKYGLTLWKEKWGDDPDWEKKYYKSGDGYQRYQKDYVIDIDSIIITKKEKL